MSRDSRERLQDILEALDAIARYVGGSLAEPTVDDQVVLDAVLFRLLIIGEAAKNVDDELQAAAPGVPWSNYAGLRDVIAVRSTTPSASASRSTETRPRYD
jgi:uncharacterized protein with HEPN domain